MLTVKIQSWRLVLEIWDINPETQKPVELEEIPDTDELRTVSTFMFVCILVIMAH